MAGSTAPTEFPSGRRHVGFWAPHSHDRPTRPPTARQALCGLGPAAGRPIMTVDPSYPGPNLPSPASAGRAG
eukprot:scaffold2674_cov333-Prasinococcus_capsulatus_cf.AAC.11